MLGRSALAATSNNTSPGIGAKYTDPSVSLGSNGRCIAFAPSGTAVAVGLGSTPFVAAYQWSSAGFGSRFSSPSSIPVNVVTGVAFAPQENAIIFSHSSSPYLAAYQWSSSGFGVRYSNPSTLLPNDGRGIAFTTTGNVVGIGHRGSPYISAYPWSSASGFGSKYANPATLPPGFSQGYDVDFTPAADAIALAGTSSANQGIIAYQWSASGFGTKYSDPFTGTAAANGCVFSPNGSVVFFARNFIAALPWSSATGFGSAYANPSVLPGNVAAATNRVAVSPDGKNVAIAYAPSNSSNCFAIYKWSDSSGFGTLYNDPSTIATGVGNDVAFTPLGDAIAVAHNGSPGLSIYSFSS